VVWVTDPPNHRVLLFTREGAPLGTAVPDSPLTLPLGIAVVDRATALVTDAARDAIVRVKRTDETESPVRRRPR
jgi:hypothetical protein